MKRLLTPTQITGLSLVLCGWFVSFSSSVAQRPPMANKEAERWVQIRRVQGEVTYQGQPARVGDRLAEGENLSTGSNSSATLVVDDGIGTITVSELSNLQIQNLDILPNGAKITRVFTNRGQSAARLRPFVNPDSRFDIAFRGNDDDEEGGVAGARGTEYGVAVGPTGKTGISIRSGTVEVVAQQQSVLLNAGTSSVVVPGKAPTPPRTTGENVQLKVKILPATLNKQVRVSGEVDPLNLVFLNNQPLETGTDGKFDTIVPLLPNRILRLEVRTPLGQEQVYELEAASAP
ncbi:iron dicitrate transport regulator FecR [Microcoleus sp. FACHB-68]|uniref:FecR family protein n=1 Tax=Microcoleus sp. FACHB-68 TaxID=2692826 RepID=UPI0016833A11|nr:iron dicitrate transport regulator FecR [Microcoleus sp. FACHB-68]MBD1939071.1 iron dicitrate transport regulator FecR [Microcoleus sp. FACHB-68]